jgi:hypothetical protein
MMRAIKFLIKSLIALVILLGIATVIGGATLGIVSMWRLDLIQAVLPKEKPILPVTVELRGPRFAVQGDRIYFHSVVSGNAGKPAWKLDPTEAGALTVVDNSTVQFSSLKEGKFTLTVVIAGQGNQAALDQITFENVTLTEEQSEKPATPLLDGQPAQPGLVHAMQEMFPPAPKDPTPMELTIGALEQVASENKAAEARYVAGILYEMARRAREGMVPRNFDFPLEIEKEVDRLLKERAPLWHAFTISIDTIMEEMRRQGRVTSSVGTQAVILMEIANTLVNVR